MFFVDNDPYAIYVIHFVGRAGQVEAKQPGSTAATALYANTEAIFGRHLLGLKNIEDLRAGSFMKPHRLIKDKHGLYSVTFYGPGIRFRQF